MVYKRTSLISGLRKIFVKGDFVNTVNGPSPDDNGGRVGDWSDESFGETKFVLLFIILFNYLDLTFIYLKDVGAELAKLKHLREGDMGGSASSNVPSNPTCEVSVPKKCRQFPTRNHTDSDVPMSVKCIVEGHPILQYKYMCPKSYQEKISILVVLPSGFDVTTIETFCPTLGEDGLDLSNPPAHSGIHQEQRRV